MFQKLRAAWRAGRAGQPLPAEVDRSAGRTAAIVGVAGIAVIAVFSTAYGFGRIERANREGEDRKNKAIDDEKEEIERLGREMHKKVIQVTVVDEQKVDYPDEEETVFRQDPETGEITDPKEDEPEQDDVDDLWKRHVQPPS